MRDRIYWFLTGAATLLSLYWNASDLFSYWGTGLLTLGLCFVLAFTAFNHLVPEEKFLYGPPLFVGTWILGQILQQPT